MGTWRTWVYIRIFEWLEARILSRAVFHETQIQFYEGKLSELQLLSYMDRHDPDKRQITRWAEGMFFRRLEHHRKRLTEIDRHLLTIRTWLNRLNRWTALRKEP